MGNLNQKRSRPALMIVLVAVCISILGAACSVPLELKPADHQNTQTPTDLPNGEKILPTPIWVMAEISPVLYDSYLELAHWNDIIVIGEIVDAEYLLLPTDESHEYAGILHSEFQVARIYQVEVDEYLQEEGETTITVVQPLKFLFVSRF